LTLEKNTGGRGEKKKKDRWEQSARIQIRSKALKKKCPQERGGPEKIRRAGPVEGLAGATERNTAGGSCH